MTEIMFEPNGTNQRRAVIKVIGVGGNPGWLALHLNTWCAKRIEGVEFFAAVNTDIRRCVKRRLARLFKLVSGIAKGHRRRR